MSFLYFITAITYNYKTTPIFQVKDILEKWAVNSDKELFYTKFEAQFAHYHTNELIQNNRCKTARRGKQGERM